MRRLLLCGLLTLAGAAWSTAQTDSLGKRELRRQLREERLQQTDSYFVMEALGTFRQAQDQATSRQIYRGWGGGIGTGGLRFRDPHFHEFQARGGYNHLQSQAATLSRDFWGNFSYRYLHLIREDTPYQLWLGGQADILAQVRYTPALGNSSLHWDVVGSLGLAGRLQRAITLPIIRRDVQAFGHLHLPLLAYVNRPAAPITVSNDMQQTISTIGRLRQVTLEFGLFFPVRRDNPNHYRLSYRWELFRWRDNDEQRVITGLHLLTFGILVNTI
jgi:hypothetical protein